MPRKSPVKRCLGTETNCAELGYTCAGAERGSCNGWVCTTHTVVGSQKPFLHKKICQVCATRQTGTTYDERGGKR